MAIKRTYGPYCAKPDKENVSEWTARRRHDLRFTRHKAVRGDERILKLRPTLFALLTFRVNAWCELWINRYCLPPGAGTMKSIILYVSSQSSQFSPRLRSYQLFLFASKSIFLKSNTPIYHICRSIIRQRESSDGTGALVFNLRFVQGADQDDAGLAASEVHASSSQQSGSVQVVFPHEGYVGHRLSPGTLLK